MEVRLPVPAAEMNEKSMICLSDFIKKGRDGAAVLNYWQYGSTKLPLIRAIRAVF